MLIHSLRSAKAHIKGNRNYPQINGIITFKETKEGTMLTAKIKGLPQSKTHCQNRFFGLHIHEGTSCTGNPQDPFADAKGHYNPTNCPHPFHIGDLPPLLENDGEAYMQVLVDKIQIKDILGKVMIIHEMPDDFKSQPSGDAGAKIACGKIVK